MNRAFDLVILDLDGTILDLYQHAPISERVRAAIHAVQAADIPVTIATGRTLDYVREHVAPLGIRAPVVTGQGSVIGDPITGEVLDETTIPLESARRAADWIDAHDYVTALYFTQPHGKIRIVQNRAGTDPAFFDHVFGSPRTLVPHFGELLAQDTHPPMKFIVAEPEEMAGSEALVQELQATFAGVLNITRTHPRLVEGTALGVDKGAGVLRLCARLGIDPARVLAIGDSENDIPMLQAVGFGVAMGNAAPSVKAVAKWVAPSINAEGAAVALEKWVLD